MNFPDDVTARAVRPRRPDSRLPRPRRTLALAAVLAVILPIGALPAPVDLDVSVPPGSPLDWGRAFPAITPADGSFYPESSVADSKAPTAGRTRARREHARLDVRFSSSFNLTRILTYDIVVELDWVETRPRPRRSGRSNALPEEPVAGDPFYWTTLVAMLRLMLHPSESPRSEVETHLIEVGEYALPALDSGRKQSYLARTIKAVEKRVKPELDHAPEPLVAEDPYESMLMRFVFDELTADHPYNPVGTFGRRLFLFRDQFEPQVAAYTNHQNAYLRRAAVSALGRYRTNSAVNSLLGIALTSEDAVSMTRACAGLGRIQVLFDPAPLLVRLEASHDLHERTALIGALGRIGSPRCVGTLVEEGRSALARTDGDLLVTVLTALAKISVTTDRDELMDFTRDVLNLCNTRPLSLEPSGGMPPITADRPDSPRQRADILRHLAIIIRARLNPVDPEVQTRILGMMSTPPADPANPGAKWLNYASIDRVQVPARFVYIDLLSAMGQPGQAPLARMASNPSVDLALRGHALSRLPWSVRQDETTRMLDIKPAPMRIQAFKLAVQDSHPELVRFARAELARSAQDVSAMGSPEQRHLTLEALRALGNRNKLAPDDLLPLLHHAEAPKFAFGDLPMRIRNEVAKLIDKIDRGGMTKTAIGKEARRLVDLVVEEGMRPDLEKKPSVISKEIAKQLGTVGSRSDVVAFEVIARNVEELLVGYPIPRWSRERGEFEPQILLEQEILLALGRAGTPETTAALAGFLDNRRNSLRSVACLALGLSADPEAAQHLGPFLMDPEPFTRWCAYLSLEHLIGVSERIDWMYGPEQVRFAAAQRIWKALIKPR